MLYTSTGKVCILHVGHIGVACSLLFCFVITEPVGTYGKVYMQYKLTVRDVLINFHFFYVFLNDIIILVQERYNSTYMSCM